MQGAYGTQRARNGGSCAMSCVFATVRAVQPRNVQRSRRVPNRKLQELRINAGLSPNDLAAECGVSSNTIRLAERGYTPGPRIQFCIADRLGVKPLDIWPLSTQRVPS